MPCAQRYGCGRALASVPRRRVAATTPHPRTIAAMALEPAIQGDVQREAYSWPLSVPRYPVTRNTNSKVETNSNRRQSRYVTIGFTIARLQRIAAGISANC